MDFSHAGYGGGGVKLPDVPVRQTLSPESGDNTERIQAAIERVPVISSLSPSPSGAVLMTSSRSPGGLAGPPNSAAPAAMPDVQRGVVTFRHIRSWGGETESVTANVLGSNWPSSSAQWAVAPAPVCPGMAFRVSI